jgi:hypothetical protein
MSVSAVVSAENSSDRGRPFSVNRILTDDASMPILPE